MKNLNKISFFLIIIAISILSLICLKKINFTEIFWVIICGMIAFVIIMINVRLKNEKNPLSKEKMDRIMERHYSWIKREKIYIIVMMIAGAIFGCLFVVLPLL